MYQLEVKRFLVEQMFPPSEGWAVTVDVDAMERGKGPQHSEEKRARAQKAEDKLLAIGTTIGAHSDHGRADVVAVHPAHGKFLVEVEGQSSRQKEQAMYSALGQAVLLMTDNSEDTFYAIAAPDQAAW